jgi:hypothetical protein
VRAAVAFAFGLVHGFGFAGVAEMGARPTGSSRLFGFNAGVEVGQLAVVALIWPLLRACLLAMDAATCASPNSARRRSGVALLVQTPVRSGSNSQPLTFG